MDDIHASVVVTRKVRGILSANAGSRSDSFLHPYQVAIKQLHKL